MSLRLKMILGIGAILLSVTLVYALIALRSQAKYRQDLALHQADLIAAMADRSLTSAMGLGETEVIRAIRPESASRTCWRESGSWRRTGESSSPTARRKSAGRLLPAPRMDGGRAAPLTLACGRAPTLSDARLATET